MPLEAASREILTYASGSPMGEGATGQVADHAWKQEEREVTRQGARWLDRIVRRMFLFLLLPTVEALGFSHAKAQETSLGGGVTARLATRLTSAFSDSCRLQGVCSPFCCGVNRSRRGSWCSIWLFAFAVLFGYRHMFID